MTSEFKIIFSYENKGAAKVAHWASSEYVHFYRETNLCFFYSQRATEIYGMQMIKALSDFISIREIITIIHVYLWLLFLPIDLKGDE